jgi:transcription termination factor Rho
MAEDLNTLHLADLYERAQRLGVPRFRMLSRDELIDEIGEAQGNGAEGGAEPAERPSRSRRGRRRGSRGRGRRGGEARDRPARGRDEDDSTDERDADELSDEDVETEDVVGVLDRMPQGYGFLRLEDSDEEDADVYVSASQIRRCELRPGDTVAGPARPPRRGERHRALVRVASVNGTEPAGERTGFEDLTAVAPSRRIPLGESDDVLVRAIDALVPLAFGQRVLVLAEPRSGRTTLLRALARSLEGSDAHLQVLLADERPEEVTEWQRAVPGAEIVGAAADQEPAEQVRAVELAIGQAKRRAEAGDDVVVILDSLSRLALGYRDPARVKRLFGAGRDLAEEGSGSLTIIATVLASDERGAAVREALETTENVLLRLDAGLAAKGVVPALVVAEARATGEDELRSADELAAARALRAELAEMEPEAAALALAERIEGSKSNAELLS